MQVQQQTETTPVAPVLPADVDVMKELARPTVSAIKAFNSALTANCSGYQREWVEFLTHRMQENLAMPAHLAACRSPVDFGTVWAEYWARLFNQYSEEWRRLANLCPGAKNAVAASGTEAEEATATAARDPRVARAH